MPIHFYDIHNPALSLPVEEVLNIGKHIQDSCYVPSQIPQLCDSLIYKNPPPSFRETAFEISRAFFCGVIPESDLYTLIAAAFPFKVPVYPIDPRTYILELTHGESGSCADFGARFTAQLTAYFHNRNGNPIHILFAGEEAHTLALAKAFAEHEQLHCTFLYPKEGFHPATEQQLLALSPHIHSFAVEGSLADCKKMVQKAAADESLTKSFDLCIPDEYSIGYLFAYTFCCVYASLTVLSRSSYDNSIEKPQLLLGFPLQQMCGMTAAVLAKRMNAPITGFITTAGYSCALPDSLLKDFKIDPADYEVSCQPQNICACGTEYERLKILCGGTNPASDIALCRLRQDDILAAMRTCNDRTGVIIGPEAAEIWQVWNAVKMGLMDSAVRSEFAPELCSRTAQNPRWISEPDTARSCIGIIAETSHPALHTEMIKSAIGREPPIPYRFEYNPQNISSPLYMQPSAAALQDWLHSII